MAAKGVAGITALMEGLKVGDGNASNMVSHVTAEPKVAGPMVAKLAENAALAGKGDEATIATNALKALEALANECTAAAEPHLVGALPAMLNAASNGTPSVRTAAEAAVKALTEKMSPNTVRQVLPILFKASRWVEISRPVCLRSRPSAASATALPCNWAAHCPRWCPR